MTQTPPLLSVAQAKFAWPGRGAFSLEVARFQMAPQERVLLLGESGAGKSTLLAMICGTVAAQSGQVQVAGQDLAQMRGAARDRLRAEKIGVIFQQFNLLPFASVLDNILLPLSFAPSRRARVADANQEAAALCAALALPDDILGRQAARLSVGQQQRVAVARALIGAPALIVADEPTSALDDSAQAAFLDVLFDQVGRTGAGLLMVSHDARLADRFDRVVSLHEIAQTTDQTTEGAA